MKPTFSNKTWNRITLFFVCLFIAYMSVSYSRAEEPVDEQIQQFEFMIGSCAVAYAALATATDFPSVSDEAWRWRQTLIGFMEYDEVRADLYLTGLINAATESDAPMSAYQEVADTVCVELRQFILDTNDMTLDEWFKHTP